MVFSSYLFIFFFLPAALTLYYLCPKRGRHLTLTLISYVFYGWANPLFVCLMFFSTVVDYVCGLKIGAAKAALPDDAPAPPAAKTYLYISLIVNLAVLGFFKYFNFAAENYDAVLAALGIPQYQFNGFFRIVLPLGISFYTFQSMSYTIDVYRGDGKAIRNFTDFACYVSMFPQLVAGPIIRFQDVADQLAERTHTWDKFTRGAVFFMFGLGKKVLLANPCGKIADTTFSVLDNSWFDAWYGLIAYAFQIYFDFSGYSDMAIGLGLMFGFVFAKNFNSPYWSRSITEFWRRWHISLSSWLRDYLYIPLGGNRKGRARTYFNLAIVMVLGGLWHGASWNFLIWGTIHGGWLAFERALGKESFYSRLPGFCQTAITFVIVLIAWVFFRADDLPAAGRYLAGLFGAGGSDAAGASHAVLYNPYYIVNFGIAAAVVWGTPQTWDFTRKLTWSKLAAAAAVFALAVAALTTQSYNPFIYFIF